MAGPKMKNGVVDDKDDVDYGRQPGQASMDNATAEGRAAVTDKSLSDETRNKAIKRYYDTWGEYPNAPKGTVTPTHKPEESNPKFYGR